MSKPETIEHFGEASLVRDDLLEGYPLLQTLGGFIHAYGPPEDRARPIVVSAPHQAESGGVLSGGHDVHTGPLARRLARVLNGRCVVANALRTFVDLNKSPFDKRVHLPHLGRVAFRQADRRLKLYYQSQVFASNPAVVIEIHGHVRGVYDIEVSIGFQLGDDSPQDRALAAALWAFKDTLTSALAGAAVFDGEPPTVGVYPLDEDVRFAATGTHTFNKVERLRELGVNVAGLHIELARSLRPDPRDETSEPLADQLTDCLGRAIDAFVHAIDETPRFDPKELIDAGFELRDRELELLSERGLVVRPAPKAVIGRPVVCLARTELADLGLTEEQAVIVSAERQMGERVELLARGWDSLQPGSVGLARKYRERLGLGTGELAFLARRVDDEGDGAMLGFVCAVRADGDVPQHAVRLGPLLAEALKVTDGALTLTSSQHKRVEVEVVGDAGLSLDRGVEVSAHVARELNVTFGDLVCFTFDE